MISLVTRPGSAPTLAIALRNHIFRVSPLHVDIVIDLNVKATSSNVLTVVRFAPLNYTTDAREVIDWLLFSIG